MKRTFFLTSALLIPWSLAATAEEDLPADLTRLKERHAAELKTATAPIHARHLARLQALMKTMTQRGDLDSAMIVKQEIESLKKEMAAGPKEFDGPTAFRAALTGTIWTWEKDGAVKSRITFAEGGKIINANWTVAFTWKVSKAGEVTLENSEYGTAKLKFDSELKTFEGADFKTEEPIQGKLVSEAAGTKKGESSPFGKPEKK